MIKKRYNKGRVMIVLGADRNKAILDYLGIERDEGTTVRLRTIMGDCGVPACLGRVTGGCKMCNRGSCETRQ